MEWYDSLITWRIHAVLKDWSSFVLRKRSDALQELNNTIQDRARNPATQRMQVITVSFETTERSEGNYVYDDVTISSAIVNVPMISRICVESCLESPSTTTSIGFFTRDPIGFKGSPYCLYEAFDSRSLQQTDPSGMGTGMTVCGAVYTSYNLYPCVEFARIFNEFDSDCQQERDNDEIEFIDKYAGLNRGGAYCNCIGALCPETAFYKEEYANLCCVLNKRSTVMEQQVQYSP